MAEFKQLIITEKGQALMAKMISGTGNVQFTKINVSDTAYSDSQLPSLTSLSGVRQTTLVSKVVRTNEVAIQVEGAVTNTDLTSGYYMRTIGLYAVDPDEGEILYAVTNASIEGYMPPYNGITVSGAFFKLVTTVSNSDNVTLEVDPAAVATIGDIQYLQEQITDLQAYVGYSDDDIVGVEADFKNSVFKRLAGAVNRTPGEMFNDIDAFGGRKRCNVADDGTINAYHGDSGFMSDGSNGQVMVEQPKFYYKVVPLEMEKITDGIGFHLRKARYYVSDKPKLGFKLHPSFIRNEREIEKIYLPAYEASIYDVSLSEYLRGDETATFGEDMLSSVAYSKPASGDNQSLTRSNTRTLASNRGAGWQQADILTSSLTQMLFIIEYASFNSQDVIGRGVVDLPSGSGNESLDTGLTLSLGNESGMAVGDDGETSISYRGEENFWGNVWGWVDGLNVNIDSETRVTNAYIADHDFADDTDEGSYGHVGFNLAPDTSGYISAFGYSEKHDFLFLPTETNGNSSVPVGDRFWNTNTGWRVARLGGRWSTGDGAGAFSLYVNSSSSYSYRSIGGRLVYVPQEEVA